MRKLISLILCLALLCGGCAGVQGRYDTLIADAAEGIRSLSGAAGKLLADQETFPAGTPVCDWAALAFALAGENDDYASYLRALEDYVTQTYAEKGGLSRAAATEWHRIALTVLALGSDPTNFGENAAGEPIDLIRDGGYDYKGESLGFQGVNGWIFALIMLDAKAYRIPEDARYGREEILNEILAEQRADGGFGIMPDASDVDSTAMALQALAPYAQGDAASAVEQALGYLSAAQTAGGGFESFGAENVEAAAQVIIALCALGIDVQGDSRFLKNGQSPLDAVLRFRRADGSFAHLLEDGHGDVMATEQAMLALLALDKAQEGGGSLYNLADYEPPKTNEKGIALILIAGAVAAAAVIGITVSQRRKYA